MLSTERGSSGINIPTWNRQAMCSKREPVNEAKRWLDRSVTRIENSERIVVLGLGGGFHIHEFKKRFPNKSVLIFSAYTEIEEIYGSDFLRDKNIHIKSGYQILKKMNTDPEILSFLNKGFTLLKFSPATRISSRFFDKIQKILIGRDPDKIEHIFSSRNWNYKKVTSLIDNELLSVKHICESLHQSGMNEEDKLIWLTLGELVK